MQTRVQTELQKNKTKKQVRQVFAMKHYCNNTDVQVPAVPFIWLHGEIHFQGRRESNERARERGRVHEFKIVSG